MLASYTPSGRIGVTAIVGVVAVGLAAVVLAGGYQRLTSGLPLSFLKAFATLGFGVAIGFAMRGVFEFGHNRNRAFRRASTLAVVALAWVASFAWDKAFHNWQAEATGMVPMDYVRWRMETGIPLRLTSMDEEITRLRGWAVLLVWAIECMTIAAGAWGVVASRRPRPYCENCRRWTQPREFAWRLHV